ncbi:hypothetical protein LWI29_005400 [Acer saccharum]|uniref:FAS1 domain-containing protein n=1 Tax=Acer saccharum TaxID=4024 RepID=A0AA39SBM9_ACESA|nr:hypothetical protein LWI29_005400 [Acer saccharum]
MASASLITLFSPLLLLVLLLAPPAQAQGPAAPAPGPAGPFNLTGLLDKAGQYTTLMRLLNSTGVGNQIVNQLNNSDQGMTLFAPTDNAFNNLKPGTLNSLSAQKQVELVLSHVLPKFYKLSDFPLVSNPVRTQATGQDGGAYGLNFTSLGNQQVNVSTDQVETQVNNALTQVMPLAVYQVDEVLLSSELLGTKSQSPSTSPTTKTSNDGSKSDSGAKEPTAADGTNAGGRINSGLGIVAGLVLLCMGILS